MATVFGVLSLAAQIGSGDPAGMTDFVRSVARQARGVNEISDWIATLPAGAVRDAAQAAHRSGGERPRPAPPVSDVRERGD